MPAFGNMCRLIIILKIHLPNKNKKRYNLKYANKYRR